VLEAIRGMAADDAERQIGYWQAPENLERRNPTTIAP
jgi:hypothetical protein